MRLAAALKALPNRAPPSQASPDVRLGGLVNISEIVEDWLGRRSAQHLSVVEG
jgi:predicted glycosyltransferase